ncbi:orotate phosphoribosyltransferase [Flavobacterium sp.]|uniref:orotate phosphoribosyltransferase n=1 Tax=Flavobacterium sp. TaxID=239 RepID=UPI0035280FC7
MIFDINTAEKTAELLLQINAIKLNSESPFTWASGWKSPIYCDNRVILSFPAVRNFVKEAFAKQIEKKFGKPNVIAGVATGAIGIGILVAECMGLPFVYVRPEPKKHGRQNQIEGFLQKGQSVVVVEDLISTGGSSLQAIEALKNAGATIKGMAAIFSYGFDVSVNRFRESNLEVFTLSNYDTLLKEAVAKKYISVEELSSLEDWRKNPADWKK